MPQGDVQVPGAQAAANGQGEQAPQFQMPDKLRGKSLEEVAKIYVDLERDYGKRSDYDQLRTRSGELEQQSQKFQEALQAWEQYRPALEKIGWDTSRLTQAQQQAQGQPDFLTQRLSKYGEILDAQEQAKYLLNDVIVPLYQADQQRIMQGVADAMRQAVEAHEGTIRQREKLLFSMLKRALPETKWDDIYGDAMKLAEKASKGYDPFEESARQEQERTRMETELQKKYEQRYNDRVRELENKRLATVTGSTRVSAAKVKPGSLAERRNAALSRLKEVAPDL